MRYLSTRGEAPALGFNDVLLAGLARDGGLYLPETWPRIDEAEIAGLTGKPYAEVAYRVIHPFVDGDIADADLKAMIDEAYATFDHTAVAPLVQLSPRQFVLELFHGPTLAFKDVAMQLLARLMDHVLAERGRKATIVGATSGDTGGAAIEAFRGRDNVDIFILFPEGRVSPVQQRQMTTVADANVHAIAVKGNFDDCQAYLKAMFNDAAFRDRVGLSGVNSINWARIVAQIVYYFTAAVALGAPARKVAFSVPTGNFGDILAGYAAVRMGLPVDKLIVATNINDILYRALETGRYEVCGVVPTASPSMDIQVSSNFERLLFEAHGRDAAAISRMMAGLSQSGAFTIEPDALEAITRHFAAGRTDEDETAATIRRIRAETGYLLDPHSAVGVSVAERLGPDDGITVTLATAHPAKFPDAVEAACGERPALPERLSDLMERQERFTPLPNDLDTIKDFVLARATAVAAEA
ncbi:threonine synthase [Rhodobium orientis]|uniref:Threonine synthase n=1 Tax=Rhodobium orientis TaxID=34017 RepID=A0A327JT52_9HYPH|nr:threonine synthase [Rhodobium orientis]MBB4304228.1 threonine synthase [Rhodobium orientis]MBK5950697.1 threonine synthase [Rhodobium orientis]RAI28072.1 threonine synthase [Rhodobium orientis]